MLRVVIATALLLPLSVAAQQLPGRHPGYYRAISDLNWARAILKAEFDGGAPGADEQHAVSEITTAMVAIHSADMDNGNYAPGQANPNVQFAPRDRFRRVTELLSKARNEIGREEDNPEARQLRNNAWVHIDAANNYIRDAASYWR